MSKSIKFKNNTYLDSKGIVHRKKQLSNILDNYTVGKTREQTVVNSYVKLFSLELSYIYKSCNVLFTMCNTQSNSFSQLVDLYIHKSNTNDTITIPTFKTLNFSGNIQTQLVAVITSTNVLEVYFKMDTSQSPTINIISISKYRADNSFGNITIDCQTVVNTLPSGTQKFVTNVI